MIEEEKAKELTAYVLYLGKRIHSKTGTLQHAYIRVDEKGIPLSDSNNYNSYSIAKKFPYAKRPTPGIVYKIFYTDETKQSFWTKHDHEIYHARHLDAGKFRLAHEAAISQEAQKKLIAKEINFDALSKMTLAELRDYLGYKSYAERVAMLAIILENLI